MLKMLKKEFQRKLAADLDNDNTTYREDEHLPHDMIDNLTADLEVDDIGDKPGPDVTRRAESLAQEIKSTINTDTDTRVDSRPDNSDKGSSKRGPRRYFKVDTQTTASVRGIKFRGHTGIEITGFQCKIETQSNEAVYNRCEVFRGTAEDNFDIWGKYFGEMKEAINGHQDAVFEFYLRKNNLTVTYWKSHKYQDKAKALALRAVSLIKEALKNV